MTGPRFIDLTLAVEQLGVHCELYLDDGLWRAETNKDEVGKSFYGFKDPFAALEEVIRVFSNC